MRQVVYKMTEYCALHVNDYSKPYTGVEQLEITPEDSRAYHELLHTCQCTCYPHFARKSAGHMPCVALFHMCNYVADMSQQDNERG